MLNSLPFWKAVDVKDQRHQIPGRSCVSSRRDSNFKRDSSGQCFEPPTQFGEEVNIRTLSGIFAVLGFPLNTGKRRRYSLCVEPLQARPCAATYSPQPKDQDQQTLSKFDSAPIRTITMIFLSIRNFVRFVGRIVRA